MEKRTVKRTDHQPPLVEKRLANSILLPAYEYSKSQPPSAYLIRNTITLLLLLSFLPIVDTHALNHPSLFLVTAVVFWSTSRGGFCHAVFFLLWGSHYDIAHQSIKPASFKKVLLAFQTGCCSRIAILAQQWAVSLFLFFHLLLDGPKEISRMVLKGHPSLSHWVFESLLGLEWYG